MLVVTQIQIASLRFSMTNDEMMVAQDLIDQMFKVAGWAYRDEERSAMR